MESMHLSDVQRTNLATLMSIRDGVRADPSLTCIKFGLDKVLADAIGQMTPEELLQLVANVGDQSLFLPHADLARLLALPSPLTRPFTAALPPTTAPADHLPGLRNGTSQSF